MEGEPEIQGSRVVVLGSGNAFNEDGRGSSAFVVEPRDQPPVLLDAGPTAAAAAARYGVDLGRLEGLFVTHLHGDHVAGWPFLFLHLAVIARRKRPFHVVGPEGTAACLETLLHACYADLTDLAAFEIRHTEVPVGEASGLRGPGGLTFDVVPMQHHATSVGYRLHLGDTRLAFTGDTAWCPGLEQLARGSDVLFLECTSVRPQPAPHVCLDELRKSLTRLEAPQRVLVHVNDEVATDVARDPLPGVLVAYDGWTFSPDSRAAG